MILVIMMMTTKWYKMCIVMIRSKYLYWLKFHCYKLFCFFCHLLEWQNPLDDMFFFLIKTKSDFLALVICFLVFFQNLWELYTCYFLRQVFVSAFTILNYGKTSVSCINLSGSPFLPIYAHSFTAFVLFCCLLYD